MEITTTVALGQSQRAVSIEINRAPREQFDEVAEELKRKEREMVSYMRNGVYVRAEDISKCAME